MSVVLTNEHYTTIKNFSRKITKGVNADDLSQHVILRLLNESNLLNADLLSKPKALNVWLYNFINVEHSMSWSVFNRYFHNSYNKGREIIDVEVSDCLFKDVDSHFDNTIDVYSLVKSSGLTDMERMYLNAYIDSGYNFKQCSENLDIHYSTISKHVKRALNKCRNTV